MVLKGWSTLAQTSRVFGSAKEAGLVFSHEVFAELYSLFFGPHKVPKPDLAEVKLDAVTDLSL